MTSSLAPLLAKFWKPSKGEGSGGLSRNILARAQNMVRVTPYKNRYAAWRVRSRMARICTIPMAMVVRARAAPMTPKIKGMMIAPKLFEVFARGR